MNILLFVSTILLLVSILTYGRIQTYVGTLILQTDLRGGMTELERCAYNERIDILYDATSAQSHAKKERDENGRVTIPTPEPKELTSSKINFRWLFQWQQQDPEIKAEVLKNLMEALYGNEKFFQEMLLRRPDALNQILEQLSYAFARVGKVKKLQDLVKLHFDDDDELWQFFCIMLRKTPQYEDGEDQQCHFVSLLDYLTIQSPKKIRVFLAKPALLIAIFGEEPAKRILEARQTIYKQIKNEKDEKTVREATRLFQENFAGEAIQYLPILDFTVSKTPPDNNS